MFSFLHPLPQAGEGAQVQGLSPKIYLCNNAGLTRRSKHSANSLDPRVKHEDNKEIVISIGMSHPKIEC